MTTKEILKTFNVKEELGGTFAGIPLTEFSKEEIISLMNWQAEQQRVSDSRYESDMKFMASIK